MASYEVTAYIMGVIMVAQLSTMSIFMIKSRNIDDIKWLPKVIIVIATIYMMFRFIVTALQYRVP